MDKFKNKIFKLLTQKSDLIYSVIDKKTKKKEGRLIATAFKDIWEYCPNDCDAQTHDQLAERHEIKNLGTWKGLETIAYKYKKAKNEK